MNILYLLLSQSIHLYARRHPPWPVRSSAVVWKRGANARTHARTQASTYNEKERKGKDTEEEKQKKLQYIHIHLPRLCLCNEKWRQRALHRSPE